jgi:hypothetical protein
MFRGVIVMSQYRRLETESMMCTSREAGCHAHVLTPHAHNYLVNACIAFLLVSGCVSSTMALTHESKEFGHSGTSIGVRC